VTFEIYVGISFFSPSLCLDMVTFKNIIHCSTTDWSVAEIFF